jgi:hypothetical protein
MLKTLFSSIFHSAHNTTSRFRRIPLRVEAAAVSCGFYVESRTWTRKSLKCVLVKAYRCRCCRGFRKMHVQLTIIPVLTAMPRPQYVLGTISPKPTLKNVIAMSHIEFNKLACSSSWNLRLIFVLLLIEKKVINFSAQWTWNWTIHFFFYSFSSSNSTFIIIIIIIFLSSWK